LGRVIGAWFGRDKKIARSWPGPAMCICVPVVVAAVVGDRVLGFLDPVLRLAVLFAKRAWGLGALVESGKADTDG
jgi:hypothetical protein